MRTIGSRTICSKHDDRRQYCSRRLRRIYKSVRFLHGRGRYQKKKLEPEGIKDIRYVFTKARIAAGTLALWASGLPLSCRRCQLPAANSSFLQWQQCPAGY